MCSYLCLIATNIGKPVSEPTHPVPVVDDALYLFVSDFDPLHEVCHSVVDICVRFDDLIEQVEVLANSLNTLREVILGLNEFLLRRQSCVLLLQVSVSIILLDLGFVLLFKLLCKQIHIRLFRSNSSPQLGEFIVLSCHSHCVLLQSLVFEAQYKLCLHFLGQQFVVFLFLPPQFVCNIVVVGLDELLLRNQIFDSRAFVSLQLGIETLGVGLFLYLQLVLQLFILCLGIHCFVGQFVPLLIEECH